MGIVQKWLGGLLALGAGYLIVSNPNGFFTAASAVRNVVGGTETDIITGGGTIGKQNAAG
jgi:hypothetical protein